MNYLNDFSSDYILAFIGLISLCVGSFLNVVISRLPVMLNNFWQQECHEFLKIPFTAKEKEITLSSPCSHCLTCKSNIRWFDNIPLFSYIILNGKCRNCKQEFPTRYFQVEILTLVLSLVTAIHYGPKSLTVIPALLLTWGLISITFIDIENMIIPDNINYLFLWIGLILNSYEIFVPLQSALWGAVAGYLSLWLIYQGFKLLTKKEGMGFGDFKLFALIGAWLGWQMLPIVIFMASALGSIIGLTSIALKRTSRNNPIPFGPYLCGAAWVTMLWGQDIYNQYLLHIILV
ncbi:MAG: prepilin peptidase [Francisellaceae bacterium]|jgi:leader peptidase (prepilin peptidase) / N-methyltransferase|nr:prepilin peptidase [Francisellaceae bacterium]MBT6537881.1 prepilin peptidase [Francisellaceae bacterium]